MTALDPDRYRGCLLGLAAGDAVGTTLEFEPPGSFSPIADLVGGGPFGLDPGQWTDDTSMALCLAESLVERGGFDPVDQLERYARWWREGHWSSTGRCFDIGRATRIALQRFEKTGDPYPGDDAPEAAGNGPLMKLAPVALAFAYDPQQAVEHARQSARTTHGDPRALDAARYFCALLVGALRGASRDELLRDGGHAPELVEQLHPEVAAVARGSFRHRQPPEIRGNGLVTLALEAALWALHGTDSFEAAVLAAANLGDDADTTAAICGQLAGALGGVDPIPPRWREKLAMREDIERMADALHALAHDPVRTTFASVFRLRLPREAARRRRDGCLVGRGWSVRWRWRGDGLRVHATHRMTSDEYFDIAADGRRRPLDVPPEFHAADDPGAAEASAKAWREYAERLREDGMEPPPAAGCAAGFDRRTQMAWWLDDGGWHVEDV